MPVDELQVAKPMLYFSVHTKLPEGCVLVDEAICFPVAVG